MTIPPNSLALICRTNLNGQIKHCSDGFASEHGYARDELLDASAKLLRHDLMPAAVFASLWSTLRQGTPWMGIVCNRHRDGSQRWHNVYIKPVYGHEGVQGYGAIYLPLSTEQQQRAQVFFSRWQRRGTPLSLAALSTRWLARSWPALLVGAGIGLACAGLESAWLQGASALLGVLLLTGWQNWRQNRQMRAVLASHPKAFADPALAGLYGDLGATQALVNMALIAGEARLQTALSRIGMSGRLIDEHMGALHELIGHEARRLEDQRSESDQSVVALSQMAATIQEVSRNLQHSAEATGQAAGQSSQGQALAQQSLSAMQRLSASVGEISSAAGELSTATESMAASPTSSATSPGRPIYWRSMPPSKLRVPVMPGAASAWWPMRFGNWRPAPRKRPSTYSRCCSVFARPPSRPCNSPARGRHSPGKARRRSLRCWRVSLRSTKPSTGFPP